MLQARDVACTVVSALLAGFLIITDLPAQEEKPTGSGDSIQRLGDEPIEHELQLDLTVPKIKQVQPEAAPKSKPPKSEDTSPEYQIDMHLTAGGIALREGRVNEPAGDSAWHHYRKVLELDPDNPEAQQGLVKVQDRMIGRAMDLAQELDFESAERLLEEAALVREDPQLIEAANEHINTFREQHAQALEVKAVRAMDSGDFDSAERYLIEMIALGGMDVTVNQLRRRMEEARIYGGFKPGQTLRDHFMNKGYWTPETVVVLAGSFMMGSSALEEGRNDNEGPEHRVTFLRGFAIGRTEVTVRQFQAFVEHTGYKTDAEKHGNSTVYDQYSGRLVERDNVSWRNDYEGGKAGPDDPVVHVSWNDAEAYVKWLARGTGKAYRLPSEAEFEYAERGGKATKYWWGDGAPTRVVENVTGQGDESRSRRQWETYFKGYTDRYWGPAPVASFEANPFGLFDIGGNVAEWVDDCWHDSYLRAPVDGSAWVNPGCNLRVVRGGLWASSPDQARSAYRVSAKPDRRDARVGFRIARDL